MTKKNLPNLQCWGGSLIHSPWALVKDSCPYTSSQESENRVCPKITLAVLT